MHRLVVRGPVVLRVEDAYVLSADRPLSVVASPGDGGEVIVIGESPAPTTYHRYELPTPLSLSVVDACDSAVVELCTTEVVSTTLSVRAAAASRVELPPGVRLHQLTVDVKLASHVACRTRAFTRQLVVRAADTSKLFGVAVSASANAAATCPPGSVRVDATATTRIHGPMVLESISARPVSPLPTQFFPSVCLACLSAKATVASVACKHCVLCGECAADADVMTRLHEVCPTCRGEMTRMCTVVAIS
jgi:hypothetical protein